MGDVSGKKRDAADPECGADNLPASQNTKRPRLSAQEQAASRRYLMFLEYNGNDFSGSQRQIKGIRTVQDACEKALETMTKQFQTIHFSSRTDSGVHALANSAHVTITRRHRKTGVPVEEAYECSAIQASMNHRLRQQEYYCRVTHIRDVPPGMNARYHATGRTYVYRISCPSSIHNISVFEFNRCWAYDGHLDSEAMAEAASQLLGTHDFSTFRATGCTAKTPVKTIKSFQVKEQAACPSWLPSSTTAAYSCSSRKMIVIAVHARSFLYHQMRLMVAWLVEVGAGRRSASETAEVLEKKSLDALPCQMAPPWGLYLAEVHYDESREFVQLRNENAEDESEDDGDESE